MIQKKTQEQPCLSNNLLELGGGFLSVSTGVSQHSAGQSSHLPKISIQLNGMAVIVKLDWQKQKTCCEGSCI